MTLAPPGERSAAETFSSDAEIMIVGRSSSALSESRSGIGTLYTLRCKNSLGEKKFFY
jgi:hypothetical protein